jgi:formamidopyrimidine-DNA glycosylase
MPELPEVENRLIYLKRTALGQVIKQVKVLEPRIIKEPAARTFARAIRGRKILDARRRGKYLIIALDDGRALILHFRMGGNLHYYQQADERPEFTRIEFLLASGARLAFTCPRNLCCVMLLDDVSKLPALSRMGPEPLSSDFNLAYFKRLIQQSRSQQIKPLLMDQKKIAGIGNIYADEILFEAGVRPDRRAATLSEEEIKRLYRAIGRVLRRSIKAGGEEETNRSFSFSRGASAPACPRCGRQIQKKRISGRTAYFCPNCQK